MATVRMLCSYQLNCKLCLFPKVFYPISCSLFQMEKRRKHSISMFQKEWSTSWTCIQPVREHPNKALCTVCKSTFGIAHKGKRDVLCHVEGSEHKWLAEIVNSCLSVSSFSPNSSSHGKIVNAEVLFTLEHNLAFEEHNLLFEAAAHAGHLFRSMFLDSEID